MATGVSIYLKGLDELEKTCNRAVKYMDAGKTKLLLEQANLVKARIKDLAATQQKGSVNHSAQKAAYAAAQSSTTVYPTVAYAGIRPRAMPHAHLVEEGHGGPHPAPPHPFVQKAWQEMKPVVRQNIEGKAGAIVDAAFSQAKGNAVSGPIGFTEV